MKAKKKPARRVQAKPSVMVTALARVQRSAASVTPALADQEAIAKSVLGDEAEIGALGLNEVKLTEHEEAVLSRPVDGTKVMIKPTGQPYLSHPEYTRWFNEAFGRLGWAIVPRSKPIQQTSGQKVQVVCPFVLYIHGQAVAFAMGEQEYFGDNKDQTYGDALEATVASALRRCAKRIGVGLELWDKRWLHAFIAEHCEKVYRGSDSKPSWRRKDDPQFWDERGKRDGDSDRASQEGRRMETTTERRPPAAGHDGQADMKISDKQKGRLWGKMKSAGRDQQDVKDWLFKRYGFTSTKDITRRVYDEICAAVDAPGDLPMREPGDE